MIRAVVVALALVGAVATAHADVDAQRELQLGLNLSTDIGPHRVRVGSGIRLGNLTLSTVLDPYGVVGGRSSDIDVLAEYAPHSDSWAALVGWRTSSISIDRGRDWQEHLMVGLTGRLPVLWDGRVRPSFGSQLVLTVVRHGRQIETDWISFESDRHVRDTISVNLFLRFDYVSVI